MRRPAWEDIFGKASARDKMLWQPFSADYAAWTPSRATAAGRSRQSKADLLLYGGAAGGGKTDLLSASR